MDWSSIASWFLEQTSLTQWLSGLIVGIPFVGSLFTGILAVSKPSSGKALGSKCGLPISTFMRKIPIIGKFWEFIEDRVFNFFIDFFTAAKKSADKDDKK